jgi:hypothetical protein
MATTPQFTSASVEAAQDLLNDIKDKAKQAHDSGDVFMLGVMTEVLGVVSPIVTKAVARLHREERSRVNKAHKELRAKVREGAANSTEE